MGACLVSQDMRNREHPASYSHTAIRAEIQATLAEKTLPAPSIKRLQEVVVVQQSFKEEESVKDTVENEQAEPELVKESSSHLQSLSDSSNGSKRVKKQVFLPSPKEFREANILQEPTEKPSFSQGEESDGTEDKSDATPSNASIEEPRPQTPSTRHPLPHMRGQGATETDNRLIQLTVNTREPLRLNAVNFQNGSVYSGEWLGGKRHGQGTLVWADGSRYDGEWRDNYSWGFGRLAYGDCQSYEGEFVRNCREGKGRMVTGGSSYEGEWKNDRQEGRGIEKWNGGRYEGEWLNGHKNGQGEISFEDGSFYKGQFNGNEIHGQGQYCWQGSRVYEGQWEHNRMSGVGVLSWYNGLRFQGKFKNDKLHGEGVIFYQDGSISRGMFQTGKKHGHFIQTDPDGTTKEVDYFMGKRIKHEQPRSTSHSNTFVSVTRSV